MIYQTFKGMTATEYQAYLRRQAQDAAEAALYAARQCTDPTRALCEALMAENGNEHFHEIVKGLLALWNAEAVDGDNSAHFDGMRRLAEAAEDITFDYGLEPDGYRLRAKMQVHWPVATFMRARGAA